MRIKTSNLFLISSFMSFIFMVLLFTITYIYFDKYQNSVKLLNHSNAVVSTAEGMIDISTEMDLYLDMYKITNNTDSLTEYYEAKHRFEVTLDDLHELVKDDFAQSSRIILIQAIFSQWEERVMYFTLGDISNRQKAKELEQLDVKLHQDLKIQIDAFIADEDTLQTKRKEDQRRNLIMFLTIFPSAIIIIGLLMFSLNMYLTNLINKPIKQLVNMANKLGKKEFEITPLPYLPASIAEPIELSVLHRNFVYMADNLKKSYNELEELNQNLKAMNKSKDEFIAMVSHELRTPLNAIIGFSELLLDPDFGPLNQRQLEYADDIRKAGIHQLAIINDLLDLAKIEAGNMELQLSPLDPIELIHSTVSTVKELAHNNDIELITEIGDSVSAENTLLDERKFKQILLNLLSNAIKFTPPGKKVGIRGSSDAHNLTITVWDEGIGISSENQKKIFKKFAQIDSDLSRKYAGTGLGLPLVKALVALHGGSMSLDSEEGKGSSFTIILPLIKPIDTTPKDNTLISSYKAAILMVTMDEDMVGSLKQSITEMPIDILRSSNEDDTASILSHNKVDMIILDLNLADDLSWRILQNIKSDIHTTHIPISVISVDEHVDKAYYFGVTDFITKPINKDILIDAIMRNINKTEYDAKKILVIDDDPMIHRLFDGVLSQHNYTIYHAENGEEGLGIAKEVLPDLIILDIIMPKLNGFEVLRELKLHSDTSNIAVIVLTSKDLTAAELDILKRYNAPNYYTKGSALNKIVETIFKIK